MILLTLDASADGCTVALVDPGPNHLLAHRTHPGFHGSAAALPALAAELLVGNPAPDAIAVVVGPGSFTGIRAALAFAQGYALAAGIPVHGATIGDVVRAQLGPLPHPIWIATDSRRGRIFLDRGNHVATLSLDALPAPPAGLVLAGDAAPATAVRLGIAAAPHAAPSPLHLAAAALAARRPALPLYVDPVEARPNQPARPAPAPAL